MSLSSELALMLRPKLTLLGSGRMTDVYKLLEIPRAVLRGSATRPMFSSEARWDRDLELSGRTPLTAEIMLEPNRVRRPAKPSTLIELSTLISPLPHGDCWSPDWSAKGLKKSSP